MSTLSWLSNTKCNLPSGLDELSDAHPVTIYPNPSQNQTQVYFHLNQSTSILLQLINPFGQVVQQTNYPALNPGEHQLKLQTDGLANGLYILQLKTPQRSYSTKCMIAH
jgi:hypothetical protein